MFNVDHLQNVVLVAFVLAVNYHKQTLSVLEKCQQRVGKTSHFNQTLKYDPFYRH